MPLQPPINGTRYMVSAGHFLATQAGFDILEAGGNAVDAGVAAGLALGVVHSDMVQFSGVAPIMIRMAETNQVLTISGLGWWPKAASIERFVDEYNGAIPEGLLRTVVPAAPDAWIMALKKFGTMSFGDVASAAIRYARDGYSMHHVMHDYLVANEKTYRSYASSSEIYLPGGRLPHVGENFVQSDLARSIQYMVDEEAAHAGKGRVAALKAARDAFYRGDLATVMADYHRDNGGWLTREDLAEFSSAIEAPVTTTYRGTEVYTCGPWCQGPVLQQMLSLLKGYDMPGLGHNSADYIHTAAEAIKLSFADREHYYGDPRHVDVPMDTLLSDAYAAERRTMIRPHEAWPELPPAGDTTLGAKQNASAATSYNQSTDSPPAPADTSYCCAIDRDGNIFSATPSDVSWDAPVIPGTGFCPSSRGMQSWAVPGHASSVAPGKRPRLTPNPALAIKPGEWAMPFGTPGGDTQCQAMLQVLLNVAEFDMPIQEAIEAPRFMTHSQPDSFEPHTAHPGKLTVEGRIDMETSDDLAARGHSVERLADMTYKTAGVCAITQDLRTGVLEGGADPRRMSRAMGW
ncbi:MAG: gamma-glutamyltranspeptidase/glutathione hydrolase [Hyphomicrobiaceae bacterium]|jgi:gamma-glutamyltranspeptidase/glutathione hydrolase